MQQEVLFDVIKGKGNIGLITLNRPQVLNSLNLSMIQAMHAQLSIWARDDSIKAVVIRAAEGRAFCAGGDLRFTYKHFLDDDPLAGNFFHDEYHLNKLIFHYPKPYIAFLDGITMGGGVGISIHGSHRVATDKLLFAMPETGIGFFPDVGGTYFLPRLPDFLGYYLGLTGARIKSEDCLDLGIAQFKVESTSLENIIDKLAAYSFDQDSNQAVSHILNEFRINSIHGNLFGLRSEIKNCFSKTTMEDIVFELQESNHAICQLALTELEKKSPTSLKVTLLALQKGTHLDFDGCMQQEYRLASRFGQSHDFREGIRAVIIDKDQNPQWKPANLEGVSDADVSHYFLPFSSELA